ncbi:GNAT family N-acetyltransferase [Saccharopolyspora sp. HNM0983]|uniref:GNAT family N-acetyltransferase n=1 Tax=Saccharopolyspora montiporae TaxID=2781240 RepID=A0A929G0W7_9PSEU|nr:GNAT family N-acetyltransferase [Saccharopolyspora sp. HNM0983]
MRIESVGYDHPDAQRLIREVQQEYVARYGTEDVTCVQVQDFQPPNGLFLIGYRDGDAVASGSWRKAGHSDDLLRSGDAELKRMYVVPAFRGRGLARLLLGELERSASLAGFKRCVLETGTEQPEAIGLYRSCGYEPIDKFGAYRDDPLSRCFAKEI